MENPSFKQIQDFATKTADLAVKKLGITDQESDLVYNVVFDMLDWLAGYPSKDDK
jgi:hypothetical protein